MSRSDALKEAQRKYRSQQTQILIYYSQAERDLIEEDRLKCGKSYKEIFELGLKVACDNMGKKDK